MTLPPYARSFRRLRRRTKQGKVYYINERTTKDSMFRSCTFDKCTRTLYTSIRKKEHPRSRHEWHVSLVLRTLQLQ